MGVAYVSYSFCVLWTLFGYISDFVWVYKYCKLLQISDLTKGGFYGEEF